MASKHFVPILLLLIFLFPHIGYGAIYRFHTLHGKDLKNNNHPQEIDYPLFASLPKAKPIPPSGPSHRHNRHIDGDVHKGSAKAREKDLSWYFQKNTKWKRWRFQTDQARLLVVDHFSLISFLVIFLVFHHHANTSVDWLPRKATTEFHLFLITLS